MFHQNAKTIKGILTQAYLDNMEVFGRIFIKAKRTIDHLEGEDFDKVWAEMRWEFQRRCASDAIETLIDNFGGSRERAELYEKNHIVPGVDGDAKYLMRFMYPDYTYCVLYYILTGKKTLQTDAVRIDEEIKYMMKTWIRTWETNYNMNEPLYMGNNGRMQY